MPSGETNQVADTLHRKLISSISLLGYESTEFSAYKNAKNVVREKKQPVQVDG